MRFNCRIRETGLLEEKVRIAGPEGGQGKARQRIRGVQKHTGGSCGKKKNRVKGTSGRMQIEVTDVVREEKLARGGQEFFLGDSGGGPNP